MKNGWLFFARGVIILVGIAALSVLTILLPELIREESVNKPISPFLTSTVYAIAYILATPFFIAMYQTLKLLHLIQKGKAFSVQSIKTLRTIKLCAITFTVLVILAVIVGIVLSKSVDPNEDVTFMLPLGFIFTFVASVIGVFVALLQKLLTDAVALKSENDLIV